MNLEGKQQIWNDYQKEIADDRYYYARSCIRQTFFPGSEWAYLDILNNKLGKTVLDDPRHTTCTGIGYHSDVVPIETIMTVVARHFALMTEAGFENMTPSCITSFGIYTESCIPGRLIPNGKKRPGNFYGKQRNGNSKSRRTWHILPMSSINSEMKLQLRKNIVW